VLEQDGRVWRSRELTVDPSHFDCALQARGSRLSPADPSASSSAPGVNPIVRPSRTAEPTRFAPSGTSGSSDSGTAQGAMRGGLQDQGQDQGGGGPAGGRDQGSEAFFSRSPIPQMLPMQRQQEQRQLDFAEPEWWPTQGLQLVSQVRAGSVGCGQACRGVHKHAVIRAQLGPCDAEGLRNCRGALPCGRPPFVAVATADALAACPHTCAAAGPGQQRLSVRSARLCDPSAYAPD